jgi:hypothetical protein
MRSQCSTPILLITLLVVAATVAVVVAHIVLMPSHRQASRSGQPTPTRVPPASATSIPATSASLPSSPTTPTSSRRVIKGLKPTTSADVYAAEVARGLLSIDYATTSRRETLSMWRAEVANTLPLGVPRGTTLSSARKAGLASIDAALPSAAMWPSMAAEAIITHFQVTAVTEPPSWLAAVADAEITEPGLTARTVSGVENIRYRSGPTASTSTVPESIVVAMLCPPSSLRCRLEVLPPAADLVSS